MRRIGWAAGGVVVVAMAVVVAAAMLVAGLLALPRGAADAARPAVTPATGMTALAPRRASATATPYVLDTRELAHLGLVLESPGSARPSVSRRAVLETHGRPANQYPDGRPVQALLRRATLPGYGPAGADGTVRPLIRDRLVWAVVVPDVRMCSNGVRPFRILRRLAKL